MARVPYSINLPGTGTVVSVFGNVTNYVSNDAQHAEEVCTGTSSRRRPSGWLNPTGYTMRYYSYARAKGTIVSTRFSDGLQARWTGVVGGGAGTFNSVAHYNTTLGNSWSSLHNPSLDDRAVIAAKLKMKDSKVNLGVAFAERNRTARLLGDTARRIGTAFNRLKRGDVRAAMRILRVSNVDRRLRGNSIPQKWLELQYGWKPLLSDVFGAAEALSKQPRSDWRVTAKAHKTDNRKFVKEFTDAGCSVCVAQVEDGTFARIDALPDNDLTMSLSSLGITNPLLIAWELTPLSFVADWALNMGSWLDSLDALLGYSNVTVSKSSFVRGIWVDTGASGSSSTSSYRGNFVGTQRVVEVRRTPSFGVPTAFPRFKDPRSLGHMANGLALLTQAFRPR